MSIENPEKAINQRESVETPGEREMRNDTERVCDILRTLNPGDSRIESLSREWYERGMKRIEDEPTNKRLPIYLNFLSARLYLESGQTEMFFETLYSVLDEISNSDYRDQLEDIRLRAVYLIAGPADDEQ